MIVDNKWYDIDTYDGFNPTEAGPDGAIGFNMGFGFSEPLPLDIGKWQVEYKRRDGFTPDPNSPDGWEHQFDAD